MKYILFALILTACTTQLNKDLAESTKQLEHVARIWIYRGGCLKGALEMTKYVTVSQKVRNEIANYCMDLDHE